MDVKAAKQFGYGAPLFASLGGKDTLDCSCEPVALEDGGPATPVHDPLTDYDAWRDTHWPETVELRDGTTEHPRHVTDQLRSLRYSGLVTIGDDKDKSVATAVASQVIRLTQHLDKHRIDGDILAFLPNSAYIESAIRQIEAAVPTGRADLFGLIQSAPLHHKEAAIAPRSPGSKRKIVVSTNLAETSLTVSGVRFVVDGGLATQSEWDVPSATKSIETKAHSQAGIRQRWGRVGRDSPGWVFPVYTKDVFESFPRDTRPSSTRDNLEGLVIKAKAAGIDDLATIRWPANYDVDALDADGREGAETFSRELERAESALRVSGSVDAHGRLTAFGREASRFGSHSPAFAVSVICADQLACAPEVITGLCLLDDEDSPQGYRISFRDLFVLPRGARVPEWRYQRQLRQQAFRVGGGDDLDLVLRLVSAWERSDPECNPWEASERREQFADRWWLNNPMLVQLAEVRREVLGNLSPVMKEEVKRFVDVSLTPRARAAISRGYASYAFSRQLDGSYLSAAGVSDPLPVDRTYDNSVLPPDILALGDRQKYLSQIVEFLPWAVVPDQRAAAQRSIAFDLLLRTLTYTDRLPKRGTTDLLLAQLYQHWPVGMRLEASVTASVDGRDTVLSRPTRRHVPPRPKLPDTAGLGSGDAMSVWDIVSNGGGVATEWPTGRTPTSSEEPDDEPGVLIEPSSSAIDDTSGRLLGPEANEQQVTALSQSFDLLDNPDDPIQLGYGEAGPPVLLVGDDERLGRSGWFEIIGYFMTNDGNVAMRIKRSLLDAAFCDDPALNCDLDFGTTVPVLVGELVQIGGQAYRVFDRCDGLGRFMRTAERMRADSDDFVIPFGLDGGDHDFAARFHLGEQLNAEVVPAPIGARTISLVHLLRGGLPKESRGRIASAGRILSLPKSQEEAAKMGGGTYGSLQLSLGDPNRDNLYVFAFKPGSFKAGLGPDELDSTEVRVDLFPVPGTLHYSAFDADEAATISAAADAIGLQVQFGGEQSDASSTVVEFEYTQSMLPSQRNALLQASGNISWQVAVWAAYQRSKLLRVGIVAIDGLHLLKQFMTGHNPGDVVAGVVSSVQPYGVFVKLEGDVDGLIHKDRIPASQAGDLPGHFSKGDEISAVIVDFNRDRKRVILAIPDPRRDVGIKADTSSISTQGSPTRGKTYRTPSDRPGHGRQTKFQSGNASDVENVPRATPDRSAARGSVHAAADQRISPRPSVAPVGATQVGFRRPLSEDEPLSAVRLASVRPPQEPAVRVDRILDEVAESRKYLKRAVYVLVGVLIALIGYPIVKDLVDKAAKPVMAIDVGIKPHIIMLSPDGSRAYVVSQGCTCPNGASSFDVIDTAKRVQVGKSFKFATTPVVQHVVVSADGSTMYFADDYNEVSTPDTVFAYDVPKADPQVYDQNMRNPIAVAVSPDGNRVYFAGIDGALTVRSGKTLDDVAGRPLKLGVDHPTDMKVSADGGRLFAVAGGTLVSVTIKTGKVRKADIASTSKLLAVVDDPPLRQLFVATADALIRVNADTLKVAEPQFKLTGVRSFVLSRDGKRAFVLTDKSIVIVDATTMKQLQMIPINHASVGEESAIAVSPDGRTAYVVDSASNSLLFVALSS